MNTKFIPLIWIFVLLINGVIDHLDAFCARCAKIEQERNKEQSENQQDVKYYDDRPKE